MHVSKVGADPGTCPALADHVGLLGCSKRPRNGAAAPGPGARRAAWPARACPKLSVLVAIAVVTDRNAHAPVGSGSNTSPAARRPHQSARKEIDQNGLHHHCM
jgi:hypothetical protein